MPEYTSEKFNKKQVVVCEAGYDIFYGAQQSLYTFLSQSSSEYLDFTLLTPGNGVFSENVNKELGIPHDILKYPSALNKNGETTRFKQILNKLKMLVTLPYYINKIRRYFVKNPVDLVYCNDFRSILTCGLAAKLRGVPVIWYVRLGKKSRILNSLGAKIATKVVLIADNLKQYYPDRVLKKHQKKFLIIHTGLDLQAIDSYQAEGILRSELGVGEHIKLVATVASLQPRKGQKELIEAISLIKKSHPELLIGFKILLIGDVLNPSGQWYYTMLKQLIQDNGLEDWVYFLGLRNDIYALLKQVDLTVLASYSEGLPRTVLESLACGTPVVATDVDGTSEVISHQQNGLLVQPGDVNGLSQAVQYILVNDTDRQKMGAKGRYTIESDFLLEQYVEKLEQLMLKTAK